MPQNSWLLFIFIFNLVDAKVLEYSITVTRTISNCDGYPRIVVAVTDSSKALGITDERVFPGPVLRGQKGDTIALHVTNNFAQESTAIHFHGIHMHNNAWMDGVPGLTQADIPPGTIFTYRFNFTQTGTFWYHSHSGDQYLDGMIGPIVIDYPDGEKDPIKEQFYYSTEHIIQFQDWFHERADDLMSYNVGPYNAFKYSNGERFQPQFPFPAYSILINGRGQFDCKSDFQCDFTAPSCPGQFPCIQSRKSFLGLCESTAHPLDEFKCVGQSVRFRLIHSGIMVPIRVWIDRHNMTVVLRDGIETVPINRPQIVLAIGQKLDVIVNCIEDPSKSYFLFARYDSPAGSFPRVIYSAALLTYGNASDEIQSPLAWPGNVSYFNIDRSAFELQLKPLIRQTAPAVDKRLVLHFSELSSLNNGEKLAEGAVNNVTFIMPSAPILQQVYLGGKPSDTIMELANGPMGNMRKTQIIPIEHGSYYEILLISTNMREHYWHLHGYSMDFMGSGQLNSSTDYYLSEPDGCGERFPVQIKEEALARIPLTMDAAPILSIGDTFTVPPYTWHILRVKMDNPGPWFFHCHINWHMNTGMAVVLSVEKNGTYPGLYPPQPDFPAYLPLVGFKTKNVPTMR